MKNTLFAALLSLAFIFIQVEAADNSSRSMLGIPLPPGMESGQSMSDDDYKKLLGVTSEQHIEQIVAIYQKDILDGLGKASDHKKYLQQNYDNNTRALSQCSLIHAIRVATTDEAKMLSEHLIYYIRALSLVVNEPDLEDQIIKQREAGYEGALERAKKELNGEGAEQKNLYAMRKKECDPVLKGVAYISRNAMKEMKMRQMSKAMNGIVK